MSAGLVGGVGERVRRLQRSEGGPCAGLCSVVGRGEGSVAVASMLVPELHVRVCAAHWVERAGMS